jgi:hypothetical protein
MKSLKASGMRFVDFSNDHSWCYLNPRATHPLNAHQLRELFDFQLPYEMRFEDFAGDDY